MRADNRSVCQLARLLLALLLARPACSTARVKFANFIRMSHQSSGDLTTVTVEQRGAQIESVTSLQVTDYIEIRNDSSKLVFKVMNRSYEYHLKASATKQLTIYFYWNSQLVVSQLEDFAAPKDAFNQIAKSSKIRFPYENNTFWRLVLINPFRKDFYPMIHQKVGSRIVPRRPAKYSPSLLYYQDSAYSSRTIGIYDPRDPTLPIKVIENLDFRSQGVYTLYLLMDGTNEYFKASEDLQPESMVLPLVFLVAYTMTWGIFRSISSYRLRSRGKKKFYVVKSIRVETKEQRDLNFLADEIPALDSMRGLAVVMFIFVRSGGAGYRFLNESIWDGFSLGDFPKFFLSWIMGFSISLGLHKKREDNPTRVLKGLLLKCGIMFLLGRLAWAGFVYNQNRRLEAIKFTGYLQRLGISHLLVSLAQLALPFDPRKKKLTGYLSPRYWLRMAVACLLPLLNLTVSLTFSQDSCSVVGYLGPVIKQPSEDCYAGGANFAVDRLLMGESRIPMQTRCSNLLSCGRFDEDGILGTLNFVFGVFLGSCAGLYFLQYKKAYMRQFRHFSTQIILLCSITVSLTGFGVYSIIPINNQLWSLSYVLVCSALSLAFYIVVTALIVQKKWRGWPFRAVGKNALFILFTHQLFKTRFPFGYHHNGNKFDSTLSCLLNCSVWIGIAIVLHGYRFYIKY